MFNGTLKATETGFALSIATVTFDIDGLIVTKNPHKNADNHPDFHIEYRTPRGNMLRVGAMWRAVSARSEREYFSLTVTDKTSTAWRMNAVSNDETPEGEWTIVPLAGGEHQRIMVGGNLEALDDGSLVGIIESYDFSMNFVAVPVAEKTNDNHPDYQIEVRSPTGKIIRMGSIWATTSLANNAYFSIAFYAPSGSQHRANAVQDPTVKGEAFNIIPLAEKTLSAAA